MMMKVTCSGAFVSNGENIDFQDFEMVMPECPDEWVQTAAMHRSFARLASVHFKKPVESIYSLYVTDVKRGLTTKNKEGKETKLEPSIIGKNIKDLTWEELQEFAIMFCLREVPLWRKGDLRQARIKAYKSYVKEIMGQDIGNEFKYDIAPDIKVPVPVKVASYKGNYDKITKYDFN
jgi:hypothetical protein